MDMDPPLRFTIVIPAHNEENYIGRTLEHVRDLRYPADRFEVIVIENGSSDRTYELARAFEGGAITVLRSETGASKAKNLGIDRSRAESDWIIFLDADTILEENFLAELDGFLRQPHRRFAVGTVSVQPLSGTRNARLWFKFYDLGHRLTKATYSIKIMKRSLFPPLRFDETLSNGEDLLIASQARAFGEFFFMPTRSVSTSTRRFDAIGWWKVFFLWTFVALLPPQLQRKFPYKVVR
jgi:glycosyltransferase involved in cell wall biosynthesis